MRDNRHRCKRYSLPEAKVSGGSPKLVDFSRIAALNQRVVDNEQRVGGNVIGEWWQSRRHFGMVDGGVRCVVRKEVETPARLARWIADNDRDRTHYISLKDDGLRKPIVAQYRPLGQVRPVSQNCCGVHIRALPMHIYHLFLFGPSWEWRVWRYSSFEFYCRAKPLLLLEPTVHLCTADERKVRR
jgi:hypothetical protein